MESVIELLPPVREGFNLLESSSPEAFRKIAARELSRGEALWIDSGNTASTYSLGSGLSRLKVARAFTAYQHHSIVENLEEEVDGGETIFVPFLTSLFSDNEVSREEAIDLLESEVATLEQLQEVYGLRVLFSMPDADPRLRTLLLQIVDHHLKVDGTRLGDRFESGDFRSRLYPVAPGIFQTTWDYWDLVMEPREVKAVGTY